MKKQLKALLITLFAFLFALSVAGCFAGEDSTSESGTQTEVSDSTPDSSSEGPSVPSDVTAPEVTFADHEELTVKVGETLRLPEAFANDDTDGDVTSSLVPLTADAGPELTLAEDAEGCIYDFMCHAKGVYRIAYKVTDAAGNNGTGVLSVNVTADRDDETEIPDEENNIENLLVDGGIYKENFAKGYNSPIAIYGLPAGAYLSTESDAISGTSLIFTDFSQIIKFLTISPYTHPESYYAVSFDVKLISGTGAANFYVSFAESENDMGVSDTRFSLNDMQVGDVRTFDSEFRLYGANRYYLRLFVHNEDPNMTIAIDNITIKYRAAIETYVPTFEELEDGYTWDWTTKTMDVSYGEIVDRPEALADNVAYGEKVLKLNFPVGNGPTFFGTNGIFIAGYTYVIGFDYYTENGVAAYNAHYNVPNATYTSITNFTPEFGQSTHKEASFVAKDGDKLFAFYLQGTTDGSNAEFYVGNFTVRVLHKYTVTFVSEGETVSEQKVTVNTAAVAPTMEREGYTFTGWDKAFDNVTEDMTVTALWRENDNNVKPVLTYTGESSYSVNKGDYVDIVITASDDVDGDVTSSITFDTEQGGYVFWDEVKQAYRFYATRVGNYEVICSVSDSSSNESDPVTINMSVDGITDDFARDGEYTWNWTDNLNEVESNYPHEIVARPDVAALTAQNSGFSEKVLYVEWTGAGDVVRFLDSEDLITAGKTYEVSFKMYVPADSGHLNLAYCIFDASTTSFGGLSNGYSKDIVLEGNFKFTAQTGDRQLALYCAGVMALGDDAVSKCYIGNLTIAEYVEPCTEIDCDWTTGVTKVTSNYPHEVVDRPDVEELKAEDSGFSEKVLYVEWTQGGDALRFNDSEDFITAGKTYTAQFKVYVPTDSGHFNVYYCVFDTSTTSFGNFSNGTSKGIVIDCSVTFTAKEGDRQFALYCAGIMALGDDDVSKCYIGDITIKEETGEVVLPAAESLAEIGGIATTDFEGYEDLDSNGAFGSIFHQGAGTITVEYNETMGSKALHIDNTQSNGNNAHFLNAHLPVGIYKVSFDLLVANDAYAGAISIDLGERYTPGGYVEIRIPKNEVLRMTKYFEITEGAEYGDYLVIWTGSTNMFVDNLEIERVETKVEGVTYAYRDLYVAGGSITEDFETAYTAGNDCKLGNIYATATAAVVSEDDNNMLKWESGVVYLFFTQNYLPTGTYTVKMKIKKITDAEVYNLYICGTQVDASSITTEWTEVTYTVNIDNGTTVTLDSSAHPGYYIDDIVVTRV